MKNRFLKITSWIMGIVAMVAVMFVDAPTPIPFMVLCISLGWFFLFGWANDWFPEK